MGLKALPALLALCCVYAATATTFVVTIKDDGPEEPCATPHNCTFRGAALAATLKDNIKITTDVLLADHIAFPTQSSASEGTLKINGGNHAVSPVPGTDGSALIFANWDGNKTIHIIDLTFTGFRPHSRAIVCQSNDHSCFDAVAREEVRPKATTVPPFRPTLILDNVAFFNNSSPSGMVAMWDVENASGRNGLLVTQSTFLNNTAESTIEIDTGCIAQLSVNSRVVESLFDGNFFGKNLIHMPSFGAYPAHFSQVKAWGNTFTGVPSTTGEGAGYIVYAPNSNMTVGWSTFQGNPGATLGIRAQELSMTGSLLKTSGPFGYDQISADILNLGECSLATAENEAFSIYVTTSAWNRNPTSFNITFKEGKPAEPCSMASMGNVGCDPSLPCKNLMNQDGGIAGYTCLPANY